VKNYVFTLALFLFLGLTVCGAGPYQQTVTLLVPRDPTTGTYDDRRACLSFTAALTEATENQWIPGDQQ